MKKLDSYLVKTVLLGILAAAFLIMGIDTLFALVREVKSVGRANYDSWVAIQVVALTAPRRLYNLFPMTSLLGVIMALGQMASYSELVVMRASGMTMERITTVVLATAGVLAVGVGLLGEFIVPHTEYLSTVMEATAKGSGQAMFTPQGSWLRHGESIIYIAAVRPDQSLAGVVRFDFTDSGKLQRISRAESASLASGQWVLRDTVVSNLSPERVTTEHHDELSWAFEVDEELLNVLLREPDDLSLRDLWEYIDYLANNDLQTASYKLAFWQKLLHPLSTLAMVFLALPCLFGPLRDSTTGLRLLVGILAGFCFYLTNKMFGPLALVYQVPAFIAAGFPICLVLGAAYFLKNPARRPGKAL